MPQGIRPLGDDTLRLHQGCRVTRTTLGDQMMVQRKQKPVAPLGIGGISLLQAEQGIGLCGMVLMNVGDVAHKEIGLFGQIPQEIDTYRLCTGDAAIGKTLIGKQRMVEANDSVARK